MGLKPKNKGCANFYECCDLTKKVYLKYYIYTSKVLKCVVVAANKYTNQVEKLNNLYTFLPV